MGVDPAIAALRDDPRPQWRAQAAMIAACDAWRAQPRVAPVLADLARYGEGAPLGEGAALADLFRPGESAARFADGFCSAFAMALGDEPLGQLPFRHSFDGALSTVVLARAGTARLSLTAQEAGEYETTTAVFSDAVRHDAVVAGEGEARITRRDPDGALVHRTARLSVGSGVGVDLEHEALFVQRVERRLVTLRLHRSAPQPGPTREYALADGALVQQAAGAVRHSRHEMMLALLGRMKRREAAPLMAAIAAEPGPDSLRSEAVRETLALDAATGFAALCRMARSPGDPLAAAAGALRAQLLEAHPQLRAVEEASCRA